MIKRYLEGHSKNTFTTYSMAFRKLSVHSIEIGKSIFSWNKMDFAGHLVQLDLNGASVNMLKQASAVLTLLKEAADLETPVRSSQVTLVKKGCMKWAMVQRLESKRRVRTVMRIDHIRLMIKKLYKKPACKVAPGDRWFLVQQLFYNLA